MNNRLRPLWVACLLLLVGSVQAQVTLNLKDADIQTLAASISEITGKNFIIDPRVKGRVSLIASRPMAEDEIYDVFLSILATHGYAAIPGEKVIKIVPAAGAKQAPVPLMEPDEKAISPDQAVTKVIRVNNTSVAQLVPILRPLLPPEAHLAADPTTNVMVISDSFANVQRISAIVARIDRASDETVEVISLNHADAGEVVGVITKLEQARRQNDPAAAGKPLQLVADNRSNSILLSGAGNERLRLRALITNLDVPLQSAGHTQVVYLQYAKAEELLTVLQGVSQQLQQKPGGDNAESIASNDRRIDIQADKSTNALILTASGDELKTLKNVIAQLDIRRAQVLVEAVIAEISSDKVAELGVQWLIDGRDDGSIIGLANFDSASFNGVSLAEIASAVANDTVPSSAPLGAAIALGSTSGSVRFGALISALASDADTNVLATPTLVTLDNEEAEIVVGQNVPFVTGTFTTDVNGGSTVGNPFQTIERQDVGLTLRVRPQINEGNAVQLAITQELSSVAPSATALAQGPTTNKRSLKTNVLLENEQVLVLGGLIDDNLTETVQKVPGLGDIPVLGNLFRYRQTVKGKRNLMIFLHPVILRNPAEGSLHSDGKYSYIRNNNYRLASAV